MGFTLKWLVPPWVVLFAVALFAKSIGRFDQAAPLYVLIFAWIGFATVIVIGYWLSRAFRAATRDSRPR